MMPRPCSKSENNETCHRSDWTNLPVTYLTYPLPLCSADNLLHTTFFTYLHLNLLHPLLALCNIQYSLIYCIASVTLIRVQIRYNRRKPYLITSAYFKLHETNCSFLLNESLLSNDLLSIYIRMHFLTVILFHVAAEEATRKGHLVVNNECNLLTNRWWTIWW